MFFENIKLAVKDFISNRLRTFLSILGIVIGVASVITITTLGRSAATSITAQIAEAGLQTINIFPRTSDQKIRDLFTVKLADTIKNDISGIAYAVPLQQTNANMKYGKETYQGPVIAVTPEYQDIFDYMTETGQFISWEDNRSRKSVVVLGAEVAQELFPDGNALGKYIRIYRNQAKSFKVIAIMQSRSSSIGVNFDTSVYIPYNTYTQKLMKTTTVGSYAVGTTKEADVMKVSADLESYFTRLVGEGNFRIISPTTIAEMYNSVTGILNLFLVGVAAISLLVGGIGIMNIMLVAVAERTKEIGIRKALGASPRDIRGQFLTEAVTLTTLGGGLGLVTGFLLSFLITLILKWTFNPDYVAFLVAILFAGAIGIFFGFYPAARAAKLDPIQALSFE